MIRLPIVACFVAFVALAGAVGCRPLSQHPLVVEAVEEVRGNARVAETLGGPVTNETDGIASLQFDATGSKSQGVVVVEGKKTRDAWGVTMLELRPAGGEKLSLTSDLEARTGTDTPKFDPGAQPASPAAAQPPPGDIEIVLPPGPPGQ
jgi:hypothetical protein